MRYVVAIVLLIISGYFIHAFLRQNQSSTTEVSLLIDVTDSSINRPLADEIISKFDFTKENKWNRGGIFRTSTISDVSFNNASEIEITSENKWLSNEFEREKKIEKFKEGISEGLNKIPSQRKEYSSVYLAITNSLKLLAESQSEKRILLVYSDLMENNKDVSFYQPDTYSRLVTDPDSIINILEKKAALPLLNGIEVDIVYQPLTTPKDAEFLIVSKFYREMLESKGAIVNISANLER
jgi:hypothetical protein